MDASSSSPIGQSSIPTLSLRKHVFIRAPLSVEDRKPNKAFAYLQTRQAERIKKDLHVRQSGTTFIPSLSFSLHGNSLFTVSVVNPILIVEESDMECALIGVKKEGVKVKPSLCQL